MTTYNQVLASGAVTIAAGAAANTTSVGPPHAAPPSYRLPVPTGRLILHVFVEAASGAVNILVRERNTLAGAVRTFVAATINSVANGSGRLEVPLLVGDEFEVAVVNPTAQGTTAGKVSYQLRTV